MKAIIFDFDGTLADTTAGILHCFRKAVAEIGLPCPPDEVVRATIGLPLKKNFTTTIPGLDDETADRCVAAYRRIFDIDAFKMVTLYDGVSDTLKQLYERGTLMAIATSRSHHSLDVLTVNLGISGFFKGCWCADDVVNHKPAPDMVLTILDHFGLEAADTLVVGDTTFDLMMGQAAGCPVCGVTWGNQGREMLASVSPDLIIDNISKLLKI